MRLPPKLKVTKSILSAFRQKNECIHFVKMANMFLSTDWSKPRAPNMFHTKIHCLSLFTSINVCLSRDAIHWAKFDKDHDFAGPMANFVNKEYVFLNRIIFWIHFTSNGRIKIVVMSNLEESAGVKDGHPPNGIFTGWAPPNGIFT